MNRGRFTEEQIIAVLREHEAGAKTADVADPLTLTAATRDWAARPSARACKPTAPVWLSAALHHVEASPPALIASIGSIARRVWLCADAEVAARQ
jgi:hypothetical protein